VKAVFSYQLKPNQEAIMEICKKCKEYPKIGLAWFGPFLSYVMLHHPHVLKPVLSISGKTPFSSHFV